MQRNRINSRAPYNTINYAAIFHPVKIRLLHIALHDTFLNEMQYKWLKAIRVHMHRMQSNIHMDIYTSLIYTYLNV